MVRESTWPEDLSYLTVGPFDSVRGDLGPRWGRNASSEGGIQSMSDSIVVVGEQMSVRVHRRADVGVPDVALDSEGMGALVDQQGDAGVCASRED